MLPFQDMLTSIQAKLNYASLEYFSGQMAFCIYFTRSTTLKNTKPVQIYKIVAYAIKKIQILILRIFKIF